MACTTAHSARPVAEDRQLANLGPQACHAQQTRRHTNVAREQPATKLPMMQGNAKPTPHPRLAWAPRHVQSNMLLPCCCTTPRLGQGAVAHASLSHAIAASDGSIQRPASARSNCRCATGRCGGVHKLSQHGCTCMPNGGHCHQDTGGHTKQLAHSLAIGTEASASACWARPAQAPASQVSRRPGESSTPQHQQRLLKAGHRPAWSSWPSSALAPEAWPSPWPADGAPPTLSVGTCPTALALPPP